jgi:hypothetical protein
MDRSSSGSEARFARYVGDSTKARTNDVDID